MSDRSAIVRALASACFMTSTPLAVASEPTYVTVEFQINISQAYDYVLGGMVAISPVVATGTLSFSMENARVQDYGTTTIVEFSGPVWPFGTTWSSPITALIPQDPASGAYGAFYNAYAFPNVSDYPTSFIEQVAAQSNTYRQEGNLYATYHIELRATRRSAPRSGTGLDDYAFTRQSTVDFLQNYVGLAGQDIYFNEYYSVYSFVNGQPVYQEGRSYSDYAARIVSVTAVPEAPTTLLFLCGLASVTVLGRRKSTKRTCDA